MTEEPIDERVGALWTRVLGMAPAGPHDDFLELGGASMLVIRFLAAVETDFGVRIRVEDFLRDSTFGATVRAVSAPRAG
ncbi:acyl carrier protein [Amycolatopsis sp., V23-08]|uniref:Acyl carrier protein n=1 Tax=Amycolatopsis heterodermiae TaxID=3110235 RepID=A0ABU5R8R7_9PSEU|nr:acyl carrier protein [Amycolatopsis sp., V23-08]MEA5362611.1 acyl carrier protein [Amycolatopsis sp., V23-08]